MCSRRDQLVSDRRCSSLTSIVILGVPVCGLDALWKFHVDVHFNRSLWIGHNKINLTKGPTENDTEDYHKPDGEPCHSRCLGLKIVHSVDLLSAMEIQSCLV
jgi:hypothetical protein